MNQPKRQLREYFDALRRQSGISEKDVRGMLSRHDMGTPARRRAIGAMRPYAIVGVVAAVVLGTWLVLIPSAPRSDGGTNARARSVAITRAPEAGGSAAGIAAQRKDDTRQAPSERPSGGTPSMRATTHGTLHKQNEDPTQEISPMKYGTMTKKWGRTITSALTAGLAAITMGNMHVGAQVRTTVHVHHDAPAMGGTKPAIVTKLENEIGSVLADFWQGKLNGYKTRVDATLTAEDLAALNNLRVRFAVLVSELLRDAHNGEQASAVKKDDARSRELMAIYTATREIAGRNHAGLVPIGEAVKADIVGCARSIRGNINTFVAENRTEIEQAGLAAHLTEGVGKMDSVATWIGAPQGSMAYGLAFEYVVGPLVMLYDGSNLKTLLEQLHEMVRFSGADEAHIARMSPLPGVSLPDVSVLKQSVPNPASSTVSIPYTLRTSSSGSVLRLFDARGGLLGSYDRGAEPAGDHTVDVDVSKYPAGTYYYRLSVDEGGTPQVYSKTLQIVH